MKIKYYTYFKNNSIIICNFFNVFLLQAPLYPTGSEEPKEDALTWEPGEMEFDDEFSLPTSTILATLMNRRSDEDLYTGKHPKLVCGI